MRKNRVIPWAIIATFVILTVPARGQEKETSQVPLDTGQGSKMIQLKYIDPSRLTGLLRQVFTSIGENDQMKVIIVQGTKAKIEAVEEIVKTLDVPQPPVKDVELTAYFLAASPQQTPASDLPLELNEVATQLKKLLNFRSFRLLNTTLVRVRDGERVLMHGAAGQPPSGANFSLVIDRVDIGAGQKGPTIHMHNLSFSIMETPIPGEAKPASTTELNRAEIRTDIDVPEGQKVVVGKTSFEMSDNAVVLVLTAKVVD